MVASDPGLDADACRWLRLFALRRKLSPNGQQSQILASIGKRKSGEKAISGFAFPWPLAAVMVGAKTWVLVCNRHMTDSASQNGSPYVPDEAELPAARENGAKRRFWLACRIIGACWFCFFNLAAALKLASKVGLESPAHFQALLLGLWCGVGTSPLWVRILVVALSSFYFDWMDDQPIKREEGLGGVLGLLVLSTALESGLFRGLLGLIARRRWGQFSLFEILATIGATSLAIMMWRTPVERLLQVMSIEKYPGLVGLFVLWGLCVSLLSWATFYDDPNHRRRAFYGTLLVAIPWIGGYLTFIGLMTGWRTIEIWGWVWFLARILPFLWLTVYSAEAAFHCLGMRLTRSLDQDDALIGVRSTQIAVNEPLDLESELSE
ncbi:hypothetical protein LOC68_25170 [Blastopirellula sp. JC732]|uniref:Transmembrane protein n=1 Tax=Blastopirellula sediminis TaxID=2894196 RepID=A0A9X1MRU3_9BACT|nr:hypothetical protein [Blastopirellula sediminis]MCC9604999.1 hypothetical protein [Blastopirellula sediminis]MCC9631701.1 hypothetical protein [Blastopirellula sediminis]